MIPETIRTPYNFISPPESVIVPYPSANSIPSYSGPLAKSLSGQICITVTADTPLVIRDPASVDGEAFPKNRHGAPIIPASTLRGLFRSNMAILGFAPLKSIPNDYPSAVFGSQEQQKARSSRVSIGDCTATSQPISISVPLPLHTESPVCSDAATRCGFKQYWLRQPDSCTLASAIFYEAMPEQTAFSGVVRYHHLTPDELGLFLWCIALEKDCYHSIGRGRPYGYGRIRIQIDGLYEYDPSQLYCSLTATPQPCKNTDQRVAELVACYQKKARQLLGAPDIPIVDHPHIQDFLYMKRTVLPAVK